MASGNSENKVTVDLTTGIGTISFPHVFESTRSKNDKGEMIYDCQILIPKSDTETIKAIGAAIKKVAEAKWGDNWKKVRHPLRDGDKEKDDITDDGQTKEKKYPERLGHMFLNARSTKPVAVVDRTRTPITREDDIYGGIKGRLSVSLYPYSTQGNTGVGCSLNGLQKISDGEPFGNARPTVESMFDVMEGEEGDPFGDEGDEPKKDKKAKKDKKSKKG